MIEESYVSFETAKMLKEAGFDIPCLCCYTSDGEKEETRIPINHNFGLDYSRPTQALAARWLREKHHYAVCVWYSAEHGKWFYAHENLDNIVFDEEYSISEFIYGTYEEALESGLQEAIKLIKK